MVFGLVMSAILVAAGLGLFLTGTGRMMPLGVRLFPFLELVLLWLYLARGKGGWLGTAPRPSGGAWPLISPRRRSRTSPTWG